MAFFKENTINNPKDGSFGSEVLYDNIYKSEHNTKKY